MTGPLDSKNPAIDKLCSSTLAFLISLEKDEGLTWIDTKSAHIWNLGNPHIPKTEGLALTTSPISFCAQPIQSEMEQCIRILFDTEELQKLYAGAFHVEPAYLLNEQVIEPYKQGRLRDEQDLASSQSKTIEDIRLDLHDWYKNNLDCHASYMPKEEEDYKKHHKIIRLKDIFYETLSIAHHIAHFSSAVEKRTKSDAKDMTEAWQQNIESLDFVTVDIHQQLKNAGVPIVLQPQQ